MDLRRMRALVIATVAAAAAGGAVAPPVMAQNSNNSGRSTMVAMSFCNKTSGKVYLALSYRERPGSANWVVEGWKVIQANSCFTISVPNDGNVYDYAEDETDGSWGGDFKLCVEHPGPFRRINTSSFTCQESDLVGFAEVNVEGLTSKTVNLNP